MNAYIELNLALILFLPWFTILCALFWLYPRAPRTRARWWFDASSLALAILAAALGTYWSYYNAGQSWGGMWKQILASSVSYGLFLLVITAAFFLRRRWIVAPTQRKALQSDPSIPVSKDCM